MTETAVQIDQNQASNHPLKGKSYFAITRTLAMREDISDGLYRLLSILFGSYGDDGILIFKIHTLCRLMGGKKERAVRGIIKQGRDGGFYTTRQTGRGIEFFINDRQESACLIGKNLPISYKQQKRSFKKTTTTPAAKKSPPEKPPSPPPDVSFVVGLKNLVRENIRSKFNQGTYTQLKKMDLSDGQIKTLIFDLNERQDKGIGWMMNKAKASDDIEDWDEIEKKRLAEEEKTRELSRKAAQKQEEIKQKIIDQQQDNLKTMNVIYKLNDNDFDTLMRRVMKNMNKFEFKRSHIDDYLAGRTDREFILSITTNQFKIIEAFNGNAIN